MSKATGAKKPSGSQKSESPLGNESGPARKEDILGRTRTRLDLWEEHLKDPIVALEKSIGMLGESLLGLAFGFTGCRCQFLSSQWLGSIASARILQKMWEGPHWEGVWPCLDPRDVVRLRTSSSYWNDPEEIWATQGAFLPPHQDGAGGSHEGSVV